MGEDLEQLKQRIPLLTYLQRRHSNIASSTSMAAALETHSLIDCCPAATCARISSNWVIP